MDTNPASAPGPWLSELRRAERTAARVRPAGVPAPQAGGLRLVTTDSQPLLRPGFLREVAPHPADGAARAGGRLDAQGRLTCKKLLGSLGWEPHIELVAHILADRPLVLIRQVALDGLDLDGNPCDCATCLEKLRAERALDDDWIEARETVEITGKWELDLPLGLLHSARIVAPGEVIAAALPQLDAVLLTSTAYAVTALLDGIELTDVLHNAGNPTRTTNPKEHR